MTDIKINARLKVAVIDDNVFEGLSSLPEFEDMLYSQLIFSLSIGSLKIKIL